MVALGPLREERQAGPVRRRPWAAGLPLQSAVSSDIVFDNMLCYMLDIFFLFLTRTRLEDNLM